jgi:hypothetical protein
VVEVAGALSVVAGMVAVFVFRGETARRAQEGALALHNVRARASERIVSE